MLYDDAVARKIVVTDQTAGLLGNFKPDAALLKKVFEDVVAQYSNMSNSKIHHDNLNNQQPAPTSLQLEVP
jgi:hypothetical protein